MTARAVADLDREAVQTFVGETWDGEIVPELETYIAIPCKSPLFDPEWEANGHMEAAVQQIAAWCRGREIPGLEVEIVRLPGRTPLIFMEVPASEGAPAGALVVHLRMSGRLLIEPAGQLDGAQFSELIDHHLSEINLEYAQKRSSGRLHPVVVIVLAPGAAEAYKSECLSRGQREGQFKVQVLQLATDLCFDYETYAQEDPSE